MKALSSFLAAILTGMALAQQPMLQVHRSIGEVGFLVGTWTGKVTLAKGKFAPYDSSLIIKPVLGGHYIQIQQNLVIPGEPSETLNMLTFDPFASLFNLWSFNEGSPTPRHYQGQFDQSTKTLEVSTPSMNTQTELNVVFRQRWKFTAPSTLDITFDELRGKDWTTIYTEHFTNKQ